MTRITIPVVAHRMFGILHGSVGTVWTRELRLSEKPLLLKQRYSFAGEAEAQDIGEVQQEFKPAPHALYVAPGTRRTINELRDLFDGEGRAESTGEHSINRIWETADIRFRLIAIVDHAIRTDHAILMGSVTPYGRRFNQTGVVNMYFVRSLDGAAGVGRPTPWPHDASKNPGYAAMEDWEETETTWEQAVWTASHELGHLLSLPHEAHPGNLMWPWIDTSCGDFRPVQIAVARDYAKRYLTAALELSSVSTTFRKIFSDEAAEPLRMMAFAGARWRFGEGVEEN